MATDTTIIKSRKSRFTSKKAYQAAVTERVKNEFVNPDSPEMIVKSKQRFDRLKAKPKALGDIETFEDLSAAFAHGFDVSSPFHRKTLYALIRKHPTLFIKELLVDSYIRTAFAQTIKESNAGKQEEKRPLNDSQDGVMLDPDRVFEKTAKRIISGAANKIATVYREEAYTLEFLEACSREARQLNPESLQLLAENHLQIAKYILSTPALAAILTQNPEARYQIYQRHPQSLWLAEHALRETNFPEAKGDVDLEFYNNLPRLQQEKDKLQRKAVLLQSCQQLVQREKELNESKQAQLNQDDGRESKHSELDNLMAEKNKLQELLNSELIFPPFPNERTLANLLEDNKNLLEGNQENQEQTASVLKANIPVVLGYLASENPITQNERQRALDNFLIPPREHSEEKEMQKHCWQNLRDLMRMAPKYANLLDGKHVVAIFQLHQIQETAEDQGPNKKSARARKWAHFREVADYVLKHSPDPLWDNIFNTPENFVKYLNGESNPVAFLKKYHDRLNGTHILAALPVLYSVGTTTQDLKDYLSFGNVLQQLQDEAKSYIYADNKQDPKHVSNLEINRRLIDAFSHNEVWKSVDLPSRSLADWVQKSEYSPMVCQFLANNGAYAKVTSQSADQSAEVKSAAKPNKPVTANEISVMKGRTSYFGAAETARIKIDAINLNWWQRNTKENKEKKFVKDFISGKLPDLYTKEGILDQSLCALIAYGPLAEYLIPKKKWWGGVLTEAEIIKEENKLLTLSPMFAEKIQHDRMQRRSLAPQSGSVLESATTTKEQLFELGFNVYCHSETKATQDNVVKALVAKLLAGKFEDTVWFCRKVEDIKLSGAIVHKQQKYFIEAITNQLVAVLKKLGSSADGMQVASALAKIHEIARHENVLGLIVDISNVQAMTRHYGESIKYMSGVSSSPEPMDSLESAESSPALVSSSSFVSPNSQHHSIAGSPGLIRSQSVTPDSQHQIMTGLSLTPKEKKGMQDFPGSPLLKALENDLATNRYKRFTLEEKENKLSQVTFLEFGNLIKQYPQYNNMLNDDFRHMLSRSFDAKQAANELFMASDRNQCLSILADIHESYFLSVQTALQVLLDNKADAPVLAFLINNFKNARENRDLTGLDTMILNIALSSPLLGRLLTLFDTLQSSESAEADKLKTILIACFMYANKVDPVEPGDNHLRDKLEEICLEASDSSLPAAVRQKKYQDEEDYKKKNLTGAVAVGNDEVASQPDPEEGAAVASQPDPEAASVVASEPDPDVVNMYPIPDGVASQGDPDVKSTHSVSSQVASQGDPDWARSPNPVRVSGIFTPITNKGTSPSGLIKPRGGDNASSAATETPSRRLDV